MDLDPEDFEALGYGDRYHTLTLAFSGLIARRQHAQKVYAKTAAGKEARARYLASGGYARMKDYQKTPAGKAARARANAKYWAKRKAAAK